MPQLTDEQYQQALNLDAFVRRGLANPKTRAKLLEIQKQLNPKVAIPEHDAAQPLYDEIRKLNERLDERDNSERLTAMNSQWSAGRNKLKKRGYTDDGLAQLEQFMEESGIISHDHAAAAYEAVHPQPTPAQGSGNWNFFTPPADAGPDLKLLYEGRDEEFLDHAIRDTLNKCRNGEITR